MKKYIAVFILVLSSFVVHADEMETIFKNANTFYQKGEYKNAVTEYEKIVRSGFESSELYYNLGNAYYKIPDYKSAILNYERARRMDPQEEDILFNLKLANLNVIDKIEPIPAFFITSWWIDLADLNGVDTWAVITIVVFCISVILGILFLIISSGALKKLLFFSAISFLIFFCLLFAVAKTRENRQYNIKEAIIFSPSSYIKSSPSDKSVDLFILHEGTKVVLLDQVGEWAKMRLANGNEGWIMLRDVQVI